MLCETGASNARSANTVGKTQTKRWHPNDASDSADAVAHAAAVAAVAAAGGRPSSVWEAADTTAASPPAAAAGANTGKRVKPHVSGVTVTARRRVGAGRKVADWRGGAAGTQSTTTPSSLPAVTPYW